MNEITGTRTNNLNQLIITKNGVMKKIIPQNKDIRHFFLNPTTRQIRAITVDKSKK